MAHFSSNDSSDGSGVLLTANQQIILGPLQTDRAQKIAGSIFTDQPGTLYVEQSFDGGNNFDISSVYTVASSGGQVGLSQGSGFEIDVIAPIIQIRYVNGGTNQGVFRLFSRTYTSGV